MAADIGQTASEREQAGGRLKKRRDFGIADADVEREMDRIRGKR